MSELTHVRLSKNTVAKLTEVLATINPQSKRPGVANLADKLLSEAVAAITSTEEPIGILPEIQRLRNQLHGLPPPVKFADDPTIADRLATLEKMFTEFTKPKKKA